MGVELIYKHQQKTYELMKEALEKSGRAAYVFPVGCGKSFPVLKYMEENLDKKILFVSPNLGIINQMKKYISKYILDGQRYTKDLLPNYRAITYQKIGLSERITDMKPDIIVFDEIHRMGAEHWEEGIDRLIADNPQAKVIGMSATPERTDKRNMAYERFGEDVVYEMSLTEALSGEKEGEVVLNGARYARVISQLKMQIKGYKDQIELIEDEERRERLLKRYEKLESIVSKAPEIEDIMEQAMQKKNGKYIVFCTNREEMYELMERAQEIFGKVNKKIKIDYVISKEEGDGKTPRENRETIEEFEAREKGEELNLLFCVDMLNEGRHIEGLDGEVQFRPTESPIVYKQQIGRVLTSDKEAEETVIIDVVNNWLRQIDTYKELEGAIREGEKREKKEISYDSLIFTEEEEELLEILREIGEELRYNNRETYKEIIQWLETHEGQMPKGKPNRKNKVTEMTEEEKYEKRLTRRWYDSPERKALIDCIGIPIEEISARLPQYAEYIDQIAKLRSYGLGLKEKTTYEEIIEWLEVHEGKMPSSQPNGKKLVTELTEEERYERNLYARWYNHSLEKKALNDCIGIPLEEIAEKRPEYAKYIKQIAELRNYGLGLKEKTTYEKIIEWLEKHEGKMPSQLPNGKKNVKEMTEEELYERNLYLNKWMCSPEKKALNACVGIPLEEIAEKRPEYLVYIDKIRELRKYGLGNKVKKEKTIYEELIEWLETHEGKMPKCEIYREGKNLTAKEMTKEERDEKNLRTRWDRSSPEKNALDACAGIPLEEIAEKRPEYVEYIEQIAELRKYGLGLKEKTTTYEELIEWLEAHEGKMPSSQPNGKKLVTELTEEEKYEKRLYHRWYNSAPERKALDACTGIPLEEIAEKRPEYAEYIDQIRTLREHGQMGNSSAKKRMKKSVGKHVGDNEQTRKELVKDLEERNRIEH